MSSIVLVMYMYMYVYMYLPFPIPKASGLYNSLYYHTSRDVLQCMCLADWNSICGMSWHRHLYSVAFCIVTKYSLMIFFINKNLAIANRSRVSCINTNNNTMTLKSGLEVT